MSAKTKIATIAGIIALAVIVKCSPFESKPSGLTAVLYNWGDRQTEVSEQITSSAVSGVEGTIVGEHAVKGANWSIPNILRHWLGDSAHE